MQHSQLPQLTFCIFLQYFQRDMRIAKIASEVLQNKQKSVFRMECFASAKVVLLRCSKSSISKNAIALSSCARFLLNSQYLRCENGNTNCKQSSQKLCDRRAGQQGDDNKGAETEFGWPMPAGRDNINRFYNTYITL